MRLELRVRGKACTDGDGHAHKPPAADTGWACPWQAILGLQGLPEGPGCQAASSGTGLEPGEQGSGDRMQGPCHRLKWEQRLSQPSAGNPVLRHHFTSLQDDAMMALLCVLLNSSVLTSLSSATFLSPSHWLHQRI